MSIEVLRYVDWMLYKYWGKVAFLVFYICGISFVKGVVIAWIVNGKGRRRDEG